MTIETLTINDLRAKTANTADIYYTTNIGQEGEWYYYGTDNTTLDNTGTIITSPSITDPTNTSSRIVFKRIIDGEINIEWFGAKGDYYLANGSVNTSPTNNTAAIEEAIKLNTSLFFPKGVYLVYNITFPNTCNVHFAQEL
jgi:hypothetical protein